ncbi:hypothetical protein GCM10010218_34350 [Streptomyces mashuensis]|uniref:Uncharacterized protein n=1 Tax=Streptomyces mashuensis TaxID=33904 RepID=A0A919B3N2_9ACTN|nr:hypothetical protein [Streptomyces mashuensis]GHF49988.1 hypothetical protein GCM10010218_34350 [Streptomyces mashuensis]
MRDIKIDSCTYSDARGITAKISATNGSATQTYSYSLTVDFTLPDGRTATRHPSIPWVRPGKTDSLDVSTPYVPKPGAPGGTFKCSVTQATRS